MTLADETTEDLVRRFANIGVRQDDAILGNENGRFRKLYWEMHDVSIELKARSGDMRRELAKLYEHPNMQVRLKAAKHTLAVLPTESRLLLAQIHALDWQPQSGDAGMTLLALDNGTYKPT
jgi:hypothetical protein